MLFLTGDHGFYVCKSINPSSPYPRSELHGPGSGKGDSATEASSFGGETSGLECPSEAVSEGIQKVTQGALDHCLWSAPLPILQQALPYLDHVQSAVSYCGSIPTTTKASFSHALSLSTYTMPSTIVILSTVFEVFKAEEYVTRALVIHRSLIRTAPPADFPNQWLHIVSHCQSSVPSNLIFAHLEWPPRGYATVRAHLSPPNYVTLRQDGQLLYQQVKATC
ncbi:hypothetical protein BGZ63DRAFT_431924 [Mariannaea sp. PMI_226]|nr:hypothetical protein BGZ63DRAFT_431924 [Mariannaea sp. PMI_226]